MIGRVFRSVSSVCEHVLISVEAQSTRRANAQVMQIGRDRHRHAGDRVDLRGEGGVSAAIQSLITAVGLGYKEIEQLKHFDEFKAVVQDERFPMLIELQNPDNTTVRAIPGTPTGS